MALIGTTVAIILAFPFGLLAARNTSPHRYVYQGTRLLLNANRAVPTLSRPLYSSIRYAPTHPVC